jgi:hypothetical protein
MQSPVAVKWSNCTPAGSAALAEVSNAGSGRCVEWQAMQVLAPSDDAE